MRRVLVALYESRKAWIGGLTVLATALVTIVGKRLGLDAEQSATIAVAAVAAGVAIILGIAYEDGKEKSADILVDDDEDD